MPSNKPSWPDRIKAPAEALRMYRYMVKMQQSKAWQQCHVFEGAMRGGIPVISWDSKATSLPKIVCSFMGLQYKKKTCNTPGCMNPFHYVDQGNFQDKMLPVERELSPAEAYQPNFEDFKETVRFYIEENDLESPTFEQLRSLIPIEDISDDLLRKIHHEL